MVQRRGKRFNIRTNHTLKYQHEALGRGSSGGFTGQCVITKEQRNIPDYGRSPLGKKMVEDFSKTFDDGGIEAIEDEHYSREKPLLYSLNKKKRWELPSLLEENITDDDVHKDKDYRVLLSEKYFTSEDMDHRVYRRNRGYLSNCKAVHDSKAKSEKSRYSQKKYSFMHDLKGETKKNKRAKLRLRRQERARTGIRMKIDEDENDEKTEPMPELRYEVCYPRPANQYSWHAEKKHKRLDDFRYYFYSEYTEEKERFRKNGNHWMPSVLKSRCHDLLEDIDVFGNACSGDYNSDDIHNEERPWSESKHLIANVTESEEDYIESIPSELTLEDFIKSDDNDVISWCDHGNKKEHCKRCRNKGPGPRSKPADTGIAHLYRRYGKGCAIYESPSELEEAKEMGDPKDMTDALVVSSRNSDSGFESDDSLPESNGETPSSVADSKLTLSWVELRGITPNSFSPERLRRDFGCLYSEGSSLPRRFRIKVRVRDGASSHVSAIFETDTTAIESEEGSSPKLRVRLTGVDSSVCKELETWLSHTEFCTVSDVMSHIDEFLAGHWTEESDVHKETPTLPAKEPRLTSGLLQSMMGWQFDCHTAKEVNRLIDETEEERTTSKEHYAEESSLELLSAAALQSLIDDPFCGICYGDLAPSGGDKEKGTALMACGHWFCDDCWKCHLASRVQMADTNITCPAFQCKSAVDVPTVLSLLPDSLTHLYTDRCHDNCISNHPNLHWCPNPKCGKLVQVHNSKQEGSRVIGVPMFCGCGQIWCSECEQAAHWPASCKQAANHMKKVKESGVDEKGTIRSVEVKRCPECRNPIEKNGGCPHMVCACGFDFCWTCLYPYSEHSYDAHWEFVCPGNPLDEETVFLSGKKSHVVLLGELAMVNRRKRNSAALKEHHAAAVSLAWKMLTSTDYTPRPCDFGIPLGPQPWFQDQIDKFVTWIDTCPTKKSRFYSIARLTHEIAVFCVEVPYLLEYLSVLIGQSPRKLMVRKKGWLGVIDRLMFVSGRIEMLLHTKHSVRSLPEIMDNMITLMGYGKECLQFISKTLPILHQRMEVRRQRPQNKDAEREQKQQAV